MARHDPYNAGMRNNSPSARLWTGVCFLVICAAPLAIGGHDFLAAPDAPPKIFGLVFFAFGAAAAAPVILAVTDSSHLTAARVWGGLGGFAAAVTLLSLTLTNGDHTVWTVWWWLLLVLSAVATAVSLNFGGAEHVRKFKYQTLSAIVASAGFTGLVHFWYATYYAPLRAQPTLAIAGSLREVSRSALGLRAVDAHITVENKSGIRVQVLGSLYTVRGVTVNARNNQLFPDNVQGGVKASVVGSSDERFIRLRTTPIQVGPFLPTGWYFDPGEKYETNFVVQVPIKDHYASAAMTLALAMAQGERLQLTDQRGPTRCRFAHPAIAAETAPGSGPAPQPSQLSLPPVAAPGSPRMCSLGSALAANVTTWKIPRPTWLRVVTTAKRSALAAVIVRDANNRSQVPYVYAVIDRSSRLVQAPRPDRDRIARAYSLTYEETFYELNLPRTDTRKRVVRVIVRRVPVDDDDR